MILAPTHQTGMWPGGLESLWGTFSKLPTVSRAKVPLSFYRKESANPGKMVI